MTEPCKICGDGVTIIIRRNGGLPTVDATGYSGITDDGDAVCRDHFCPVCGDAHSTAEQFEDCEFYGPPGLVACSWVTPLPSTTRTTLSQLED